MVPFKICKQKWWENGQKRKIKRDTLECVLKSNKKAIYKILKF